MWLSWLFFGFFFGFFVYVAVLAFCFLAFLQNGSDGPGISILSYNGKVFFGLISDHRLLPKPSTIIARFKAEFEKHMYLGLMLSLEGRPSPKTAQNLR